MNARVGIALAVSLLLHLLILVLLLQLNLPQKPYKPKQITPTTISLEAFVSASKAQTSTPITHMPKTMPKSEPKPKTATEARPKPVSKKVPTPTPKPKKRERKRDKPKTQAKQSAKKAIPKKIKKAKTKQRIVKKRKNIETKTHKELAKSKPKKVAKQHTKKRVAKTKQATKKRAKPKRNDALAEALLRSSRKKAVSLAPTPLIRRMYGKEYLSFTPTQKRFLRNRLSEIQRITQNVLVRNGYPEAALRMRLQGTNVVSFYLHPNGRISHLRLKTPLGYRSLDQNTLEVIRLAHARYPRPKTKTKIIFYVTYKLY